jgi:hypothetical protein
VGKKRTKIRRFNKKRIYNKANRKKFRGSRDYKYPEYKAWRTAVKTRDGNMCQWPGCCSRNRLEVHHIKTWRKHPLLRFCITNGITLCKTCHASIKGREEDYETFFIKLIEWSFVDKLKKIINKERGRHV